MRVAPPERTGVGAVPVPESRVAAPIDANANAQSVDVRQHLAREDVENACCKDARLGGLPSLS